MKAAFPEKLQAIYRMETPVSTFEVGPDRLLTPASQLKLQQEAGERHFAEGNMGFEGVSAAGLAFVTVQNNCVIRRRPAANERVTVETWNRGTRGVRFYRSYRFVSEAGEPLIESTCSFALVDCNTHTLERPAAFERLAPLSAIPAPTVETGCPDPPKIRIPADKTPAGTHVVRYSQLDFNGHLNNTCYADVLCDYAPLSLVGREIGGFSIAYLHEAKEGDAIALFTATEETADGTRVWMQGDVGEAPCFVATMLVT